MFTLSDVQARVRDLSASKVLSVYCETRVTDPATRDAWRPALSTALRDLGASLPPDEHPEFERARAVLEDALPRPGGVPGAEGWVAFVTAAGARAEQQLLRAPTSSTRLGGRPVVRPRSDARSEAPRERPRPPGDEITVVLSGLPAVVVEHRGAALRPALTGALTGVERAARHAVQRRRTRPVRAAGERGQSA